MARTDYTRFSLYSITRLRRMAEKWRKLTKGAKDTPADVPPGHLAVSVGNPGRRFVIRASYLNHPVFRQLLDQAYEEYGHEHHGPIAFPCNEFIFEQIIQSLGRSKECHRMKQHCCLQPTEKEKGVLGDCRPVLHGMLGRETW
ncbi:auxin-responsive protein SAUR71-like [Magnolia sinica]|uniref:auxin-responsive protein SAUR71-like n=1 Tax=Magnolia sinica TaxID=86752 RepID=UPI00265B0CEF|nr:auxin-responsive protein SAUR71-like [Magnolia sinica]